MSSDRCDPIKRSLLYVIITRRMEHAEIMMHSGHKIQSTPLNRVTSVRGHFGPIKRRALLTENILY